MYVPPENGGSVPTAARQRKTLTRARGAVGGGASANASWLAVEKPYEFEGPTGEANLLDLFDGRRQLTRSTAPFSSPACTAGQTTPVPAAPSGWQIRSPTSPI